VGDGNHNPIAVASADPLVGDAPLTIDFSAVGSADIDGDDLIYRWDFGDGSPEGTGVLVFHTYNLLDPYPASLRVDDRNGGFDIATLDIVGGTPPVARSPNRRKARRSMLRTPSCSQGWETTPTMGCCPTRH
jgi:PKD repeat protein